MDRKFDPRDSGSAQRHKDDDLEGLHRSPEMEIHGVGANTVGTPDGLQQAQAEAAFENAPEGVDSMVASAAAQGRCLDYQRRKGTPQPISTIDKEDVYDNDGELSHVPLAVAEDIYARQQADRRNAGASKAAEFAGIDRANRCREEVTEDAREEFEVFGVRGRSANGRGRPRSERFEQGQSMREIVEELTAEEVEALWDAADTIDDNLVVEEVPPGMEDDPTWYFEQLARQFVAERGSSVNDAYWTVVEDCKGRTGVQQRPSEVRWSQYEATVEGTMVSMLRPDSWNQAQVGYLRGEDDETYKVTVWRKSNKDTRLREGQRVRLVRAKVGAYKGNTTFAIDGDAEIKILEEASEEHAMGPVRKSGKDRSLPPWDPDSDTDWVEWQTREAVSTARGPKMEVEWADDEDEDVGEVVISPMIRYDQEDYPGLEGDDIEEFKESLNLGPADSRKGCPECGSEHVSSYQQQVGGADEGMTSFNKCQDCGHSWRGGY